MRKSCVEGDGIRVHSQGISRGFMRKHNTVAIDRVYKPGVYTPLSAQLSGSDLGTYEQLLAHINGLVQGSVHIIHRPYRNYN